MKRAHNSESQTAPGAGVGLDSNILVDAARTYESDGVVCLRQVFDVAWIERLRDLAEEMLSAAVRHPEQSQELTKEGDDGRFYNEMFMWPRHEGFRQVVFQSAAAATVGALMETGKVNVLFDQLLIKEPGTLEWTPWHQDLPFWPFQGSRVCTLWLALDEVTLDSGSVEYIKGSHRWGQRYQPNSFVGDGRYQQEGLKPLPDIDAKRDELDIIHFDMEPGDCTVHHGLTLHGASGNSHTERRRRAYVTRWGGDRVTYDPRDGTQPMLHDPELNSGDELDCKLWPVVWRRAV
jgi:ectoine hydroxylase-related dioxygenase (phytanoyl-CoA dioxygenase family)